MAGSLSRSTVPSPVSPCVERHPVFSVCSHSEEGRAEPAGAGGPGDVQPGVVSGERVGGRGGGGGGVHGHLTACPETRRFSPSSEAPFCFFFFKGTAASLPQHVCHVFANICFWISQHSGSQRLPPLRLFPWLHSPELRRSSATPACTFPHRSGDAWAPQPVAERGCLQDPGPSSVRTSAFLYAVIFLWDTDDLFFAVNPKTLQRK